MSQQFFSENDTNTSADALKAIGLAEVFHAWLKVLGREDRQVYVKDCGGYYKISLPSPIGADEVTRTPRFAVGYGKLLVKTSKGKGAGGNKGSVSLLEEFPYEEQQAYSREYQARLRSLPAEMRKRIRDNPQAEGHEDVGEPPDSELSLYACLSHFKIADAYNSLCMQWIGQSDEAFRENLTLVLTTFACHPNAVDVASEHWETLTKKARVSGKGNVTLLQIVNPASGKGGNTPKANGLGIGNLDGFWLTEYLKFVGFFTVAAPFLISESKDRKTYVLHPNEVEVTLLGEIMKEFRASLFRSTATKLDILATLQFTKTFVLYIQRAIKAGDNNKPLWRKRLRQQPRVTDIGRGFDVTFYKDMGSAYATMNLATINLPGWLDPITTLDDAAQALEILEEHTRVIGSIRLIKKGKKKEDEGSEELELLRRYRDFVSGHDTEMFFDFAARYGDYYLGKRYRNQWAAQFTTEGITTLMAQAKEKEKEKLGPILENEGFQAIAAAIRRATVIAQFQAARESGYPYEVRYGLGQQLLRSAAYPEKFIAALSEFLQSYNAENARIAERIAKGSLKNTGRNRRAMVQTEHIKEIVRLVDQYESSELICKMLVAYGYARDPYTPEDKTTLAAAEGEVEGEAPEDGEDSGQHL